MAHDPGGDATPVAPARPRPPLDAAERAELRGTIYASAGAENAFRVVALDPTGGDPRTMSPGGGSWYTTPNARPLAIRTSDDGPEHAEQLRLLDETPPRPLGPTSKFVRSPCLAKDFVVFEADPESFRDLYRVSITTGEVVRLTDEASGSFEPSLSPDAAHVAFTSSRDGNAELYVLDLATKQTRRLTTAPSDEWGAAWSPDGAKIAFASDRDGGLPRLFVVSPDGTDATPVHPGAAPGEEANPTWSPDGKHLAFTVATRDGASEIWIDAVRLSQPGARDEAPSWSPDGKHLVYVSTRDRRIDLYVARSDGSAETRLTDTAEEESIRDGYRPAHEQRFTRPPATAYLRLRERWLAAC